MKGSCCQRRTRRSPLWLGALALFLPKCPACIPGFLFVASALGLQMAIAEYSVLLVKAIGIAMLLYLLARKLYPMRYRGHYPSK